MLIDTDVLIEYLKDNKRATELIDSLGSFSISSVTYMELIQGLRNQEELRKWKTFLKERHIQHILIDQEITAKAIFWMEEFFLSHHLRMADSLIAATANVYGLDLLTGNINDYRFLPGLNLKPFRVHN